MAKLDPKGYETLLKEDLSCFHCEKSMKNIPVLKEHLKQEWDSQVARYKNKAERKRKLEAKKDEEGSLEDDSSKKQKSS